MNVSEKNTIRQIRSEASRLGIKLPKSNTKKSILLGIMRKSTTSARSTKSTRSTAGPFNPDIFMEVGKNLSQKDLMSLGVVCNQSKDSARVKLTEKWNEEMWKQRLRYALISELERSGDMTFVADAMLSVGLSSLLDGGLVDEDEKLITWDWGSVVEDVFRTYATDLSADDLWPLESAPADASGQELLDAAWDRKNY